MATKEQIEELFDRIVEGEKVTVGADAPEPFHPGDLHWEMSSTELVIDGIAFHYKDGKLPIEGGGEDIWFVFSTDDSDELWRVNGFYNSWDGSEWDLTLLTPVKAELRTITVYTDVK